MVISARVLTNQIDTPVYREGTFKRSTAGAVGVTKINNETWLAVGDWDTKSIDFYQSPHPNKWELKYSINVPDSLQHPFQSINLLARENQLYLIGFYQNETNGNAVLYSISNQKLTELSSKEFQTTHGVSFQYGAGLTFGKDGQIIILATQHSWRKRNVIHVFCAPANQKEFD